MVVKKLLTSKFQILDKARRFREEFQFGSFKIRSSAENKAWVKRQKIKKREYQEARIIALSLQPTQSYTASFLSQALLQAVDSFLESSPSQFVLWSLATQTSSGLPQEGYSRGSS